MHCWSIVCAASASCCNQRTGPDCSSFALCCIVCKGPKASQQPWSRVCGGWACAVNRRGEWGRRRQRREGREAQKQKKHPKHSQRKTIARSAERTGAEARAAAARYRENPKRWAEGRGWSTARLPPLLASLPSLRPPLSVIYAPTRTGLRLDLLRGRVAKASTLLAEPLLQLSLDSTRMGSPA
jgi:hypothetical protein